MFIKNPIGISNRIFYYLCKKNRLIGELSNRQINLDNSPIRQLDK